METLLRKHIWVVDLVGVALCAVLGAHAAGTAVETNLIRLTPAARGVRLLAEEAALPGRTEYGKRVEEILGRNIFCSSCRPILAPPVDTSNASPALERTSLPLRLLAVMFAPPPADRRWSVAIVRDLDRKIGGAFTIGSKIREAWISDIEGARILLEVDGQRQYLDLIDQPPGNPTGIAASAVPPSAVPARDPLAAELERGIKKVGEHSYLIQRQTIDAFLGSMSILARAARVAPEIRDGKVVGFRLSNVKPDGPVATIGLQNGDVVSAINGLDMTSAGQALEVYGQVKSAHHLSVGLERDGQKVTNEYEIH